ncbi:MAG: ATP-binding cassette domain-containing protein [Rhodospirillales bacterium]|nr:ATP-binding cassette domain-containing protein [Rhodospirillales bacterium]
MARGAEKQVDERSGSRNFGVLARLGGFLLPYRWRMAGAAVALTVAAGSVLGLGTALRWLVDAGFASGNAALLDRALWGLVGFVVLLACATYARSYLVTWLGERVTADLRKAVFARTLRLSPAYFETTRTGEVLSRLTADTTAVQTIVGSTASMALRNVLLMLGGATMMAITAPDLAAITLAVVPLVVAPIVIFGRRVRRLSRESQDRLGDVGADIDETLNAVRTVQAFNREAEDGARFDSRVEEAFGANARRARARSALIALVMLLVFGAVGFVLWVGGHGAMRGEITVGQLSAFVFYAVVVASSVGAISEFMADLQRAAGASERLFELLDAVPDIRPPAVPAKFPSPARGAVAFENVTFRYPSAPERAALDGLSFAVEPGETVAIVGPSGAGKTTVYQLLLRFYDPQAGTVRLDGIDLRRADPADARTRIGLVPQEPTIFAADVIENIRYGRVGASDADVRAAARAAYVDEFAERLPQGWNTFLGERGVRLSGGQRQRIAIARALVRDPALLLLDEATSALDAESERYVQAALEALGRSRTVLAIAHRLATVVRADRLIVLDRGRKIAEGPHARLVAEGGLYARLAALQFDVASAEGVSLEGVGR